MLKDRERAEGLYTDAFIAACVRINANVAEAGVGSPISFVELVGDAKAVDEGRQSALAVRVGEQVECLEALDEKYQNQLAVIIERRDSRLVRRSTWYRCVTRGFRWCRRCLSMTSQT